MPDDLVKLIAEHGLSAVLDSESWGTVVPRSGKEDGLLLSGEFPGIQGSVGLVHPDRLDQIGGLKPRSTTFVGDPLNEEVLAGSVPSREPSPSVQTEDLESQGVSSWDAWVNYLIHRAPLYPDLVPAGQVSGLADPYQPPAPELQDLMPELPSSLLTEGPAAPQLPPFRSAASAAEAAVMTVMPPTPGPAAPQLPPFRSAASAAEAAVMTVMPSAAGPAAPQLPPFRSAASAAEAAVMTVMPSAAGPAALPQLPPFRSAAGPAEAAVAVRVNMPSTVYTAPSGLVLPPPPVTKTRRKKKKVPDHMKDSKYWARRAKNTLQAKKCRDQDREKKVQKRLRLAELEAVREQLEVEASKLGGLVARLQDKLGPLH